MALSILNFIKHRQHVCLPRLARLQVRGVAGVRGGGGRHAAHAAVALHHLGHGDLGVLYPALYPVLGVLYGGRVLTAPLYLCSVPASAGAARRRGWHTLSIMLYPDRGSSPLSPHPPHIFSHS